MIKGGLVLKTGYDCDDCTCGSSCTCCCGHDRFDKTLVEIPRSFIPSTPEEIARRAQWRAQQEAESELVKAKREKKDDEARAKLME